MVCKTPKIFGITQYYDNLLRNSTAAGAAGLKCWFLFPVEPAVTHTKNPMLSSPTASNPLPHFHCDTSAPTEVQVPRPATFGNRDQLDRRQKGQLGLSDRLGAPGLDSRTGAPACACGFQVPVNVLCRLANRIPCRFKMAERER